MSTSELLLKITNNEQTIYNELNDILALQDELINPKITFFFGGNKYILLEKEAYWTNKISFPVDWRDHQPGSVRNDNGYAKWEYYSIVDSQNNLVKCNDAIKNLETYFTSGLMEFFIQCDDGNKYTLKFETWGGEVNLDENIGDDNRFTPIRSEYYEYLGCYFTPEENGKKYLIPAEYTYANIGDTVYATLVEGGNE